MSETRPVITIHPDRASNTWLARFHDDPEVMALFGSDILPTAFTLMCSGREVCRVIEQKTPAHGCDWSTWTALPRRTEGAFAR